MTENSPETDREEPALEELDEAIAELDSFSPGSAQPRSPASGEVEGAKGLDGLGLEELGLDDSESGAISLPELDLEELEELEELEQIEEADDTDLLEEEMARWEAELAGAFAPAMSKREQSAAHGLPDEGAVAPPSWTPPPFPALHVHAFEHNARLRNAISDAFEQAGVAATVLGDFELFLQSLELSNPGEEFAIALYGAEPDMLMSLDRLRAMVKAHPHVTVLFMSDVGVSTIRRKADESGAWHFIDRPPPPGPGRGFDPTVMEKFQALLTLVTEGLYERHKSYYEALVLAVE